MSNQISAGLAQSTASAINQAADHGQSQTSHESTQNADRLNQNALKSAMGNFNIRLRDQVATQSDNRGFTGVSDSDPWYVKLLTGGPLSLIPGAAPYNPMGMIFGNTIWRPIAEADAYRAGRIPVSLNPHDPTEEELKPTKEENDAFAEMARSIPAGDKVIFPDQTAPPSSTRRADFRGNFDH